jgi:hypothetical protein
MENPPCHNLCGVSPPTRGIIPRDIDFVNSDLKIIYIWSRSGEEGL